MGIYNTAKIQCNNHLRLPTGTIPRELGSTKENADMIKHGIKQ